MRIVIMRRRIIIVGIGIIVLSIIFYGLYRISPLYQETRAFDSRRAYENVQYQLSLGARVPGSKAHEDEVNWLSLELKNSGWNVEIQEANIFGMAVKNVIAKRGTGSPWIIIGSHYDSRMYADSDPSAANQKLPVPGANDGASSTAVLLEIGRVLPARLNKQVWLVFFDAEDDANIAGLNGEIGSQYFVSNLAIKPDSVVILDMIGDKDLNIYMEWNSNPGLTQEIWDVASGLHYDQFIPRYKHAIIDDHTPFLAAGINAADVIDFDYPYWHTTQDTLDKVSADSLKVVGETILKWLEVYPK